MEKEISEESGRLSGRTGELVETGGEDVQANGFV